MYINISRSIKAVAKAFAWIGIIISIITGIIFICVANDSIKFIGFPIIIVGGLFSWLSSFLIYGYGVLIENSDIIAKHYKNKNSGMD